MIPLTLQAANLEVIVKLRVGVVGSGHWATEVHVPGVLASSAAECVGVYGRATDKARDIATRLREQEAQRGERNACRR